MHEVKSTTKYSSYTPFGPVGFKVALKPSRVVVGQASISTYRLEAREEVPWRVIGH